MVTKTIRISGELHKKLTDMCPKSFTYEDLIYELIDFYENHEKLSNKQINEYNTEIQNIESGNLDEYTTLDLDDLNTRVRRIERELGL